MFKRVPQKLKHWVKKVTEAMPGPVRVKGCGAKGEKVENKEGSPTLETTFPLASNAVADQAATTVPEPPLFELETVTMNPEIPFWRFHCILFDPLSKLHLR